MINTEHFLSHLLLSPQLNAAAQLSLPAAAVLVIVELGTIPQLLLTRRSLQLRHHPGQICFPGGKQDKQDKSLAATALRETEEEIGLVPENFTIHSALPSLHTVSNFTMHPYLATISKSYTPKINPDEVAEVLRLPLAPFLSTRSYQQHQFKHNGQLQAVHLIQVNGQLVWGATARVLYRIAETMENGVIASPSLTKSSYR